MFSRLQRLARDLEGLNSKLLLLVGPRDGGKTALLRQLGEKRGVEPVNLGLELARRLAATPISERSFSAVELLRQIADSNHVEGLLLLDNLELLFEPSLQINPLDTLKRLAHSKRVVAVWPGELSGDRLIYADVAHREHHDYSRNGVVIFDLRSQE